MPFQIIGWLLINSLFIFGLHYAFTYEFTIENEGTEFEKKTEYKQIFWFVGKWAEEKWYGKPIATCPICMSSCFSIVFFILINLLLPNKELQSAVIFSNLYNLIWFIPATAGLNRIINQFV